MNIGSKIKELRLGAGATLDQISLISGVSKSGLWEIESGGTDPRVSTLGSIALALGVRVSDIMDGDPDPLTPRERAVLIAMRADA